jgi:adenylate kinase family enzyme
LHLPDSPRVVVVGTSASGKTTFAARLAASLGVPRVELDELFWGPDWQSKPAAEFVRLTEQATAGGRWVVDGNYAIARECIWPRANTIVWLNYGMPRVLWQGLRRTVGRAVSGAELWHGNRESFRRAFLSKDSILLWIVTTHRRRTREFAQLRRSNRYPHLTWLEFRRPDQAEGWLAGLHR